MKNSHRKNVLSLFSGCGGMDLGFEGGFEVFDACINKDTHGDWIARKSGDKVLLKRTEFETIYACDIRPGARAAWVPFFTSRGVMNADERFQLGSIVDEFNDPNSKLRQLLKNGVKIDVVTGGFPCQDFSVAGKRGGFKSGKSHKGGNLSDLDDPTLENRGMLYFWMRKIVELVKPKIFVAENVKGLVSLSDAKEVIENDFRTIGGNGYIVIPARVLSAPEYGVPQSRERVFFIGIQRSALRRGLSERLEGAKTPLELDPYPPATHSFVELDNSLPFHGNLPRFVSAGDVLSDLEEPDQSRDLAQKTYSRAKYYGKHCQGQTEIKLDWVGPTIRAEHHGNIEFRRLPQSAGGRYKEELKTSKARRLTVRECARLQTFPDSYEFVRSGDGNGTPALAGSEAYKLIGNAVPPLLAFNIAARLQRLWPIYFGNGSEE